MSTMVCVDLFFNILLTITQSIIFCLCLTPRFKIPICIVPNIICIIFEFIIFVLFFNHMGLIWLKQLIVFLRFNTYAYVFFKDKLKYKLTVAIFNQILMIITDLLSSSITLIIFGNKLFTDVFIKAIGSLLAFFFLVTLGILFIYLFKKFAKKETIQHFGTFIFFPVSQIILITLCMYTAKKYIDYIRLDDSPIISNTLNSKIVIWWILMLLGATLSIVADFIFYRVQKENSTNKKLKESLILADYRNELELKYYQQMQDNIEETRKIRHDFYNILSTMNDANKISGELKDEIETALRNSSTASVCENNIVNLIILNKNKICLENGIELDADLDIPEDISVSKLDLLRVFSNILDNAIEANLKSDNSKKRFINLSAKIRDNYLLISAKNPLSSEVIKHNKKYETTKKSTRFRYDYS